MFENGIYVNKNNKPNQKKKERKKYEKDLGHK